MANPGSMQRRVKKEIIPLQLPSPSSFPFPIVSLTPQQTEPQASELGQDL